MSQTNMSTVETKLDIKDYLHLYTGCAVQWETLATTRERSETINGTFLGFHDAHRMSARIGFRSGPEGHVGVFFIKPLLRPLSDMTEEEIKSMPNSSMHISHSEGLFYHPKLFLYLLSKHFDLFGLIDAGLAIDKTKYKAI